MRRSHYGGRRARIAFGAGFTRQSVSTAGRRHCRIAHASSPDKHFPIAKPAGSAGMALGARLSATRSITSATTSSLLTQRSSPWLISMAKSATRRSISTIRPSPCSLLRAAIAHSGKQRAGEVMPWRCARDSSSRMPTRSAGFAKIGTGGFRNARIRTCTCSNRRSPGLPSTMIQPGAAWRTQLPCFASRNSLTRGPALWASSLPRTGHRRRAWRDLSASPGTTTNGHFCFTVGRNLRGGTRRRQRPS